MKRIYKILSIVGIIGSLFAVQQVFAACPSGSTCSTFSSFITGLTSKATPASNDIFYLNDVTGGNLDKTTTFANIESTLNLANQTGTVGAAHGGTGNTSYATGDILAATGATTLSKLNLGASSTVLISNGTNPVWGNAVTAVDCTGTGHLLSVTSAGVFTCSADSGVSGGSTNTLTYWTGPSGVGATSSPTVGYIFATSTTATSTFISGLQVGSTTASGYTMTVNDSGTGLGQLGLIAGNKTMRLGFLNSVTTSQIGNVTNNPLQFTTNDTARITILGGGNVGIGSTSPNYILSVKGISETGSSTYSGAFYATSTTATSTFGQGINLSNGCFAVNGTCVGAGGGGSLSGGTANMLAAWTSSSALTATATPQVEAINATSTTATSTYSGTLTASAMFLMPEYTISTSTSYTLSCYNGSHQRFGIGTAATTINLPNTGSCPVGAVINVLVYNPPSASAGALTWAGTLSYAGGVAPGQTTAQGQMDLMSWYLSNASSTAKWMLVGQAAGYQ